MQRRHFLCVGAPELQRTDRTNRTASLLVSPLPPSCPIYPLPPVASCSLLQVAPLGARLEAAPQARLCCATNSHRELADSQRRTRGQPAAPISGEMQRPPRARSRRRRLSVGRGANGARRAGVERAAFSRSRNCSRPAGVAKQIWAQVGCARVLHSRPMELHCPMRQLHCSEQSCMSAAKERPPLLSSGLLRAQSSPAECVRVALHAQQSAAHQQNRAHTLPSAIPHTVLRCSPHTVSGGHNRRTGAHMAPSSLCGSEPAGEVAGSASAAPSPAQVSATVKRSPIHPSGQPAPPTRENNSWPAYPLLQAPCLCCTGDSWPAVNRRSRITARESQTAEEPPPRATPTRTHRCHANFPLAFSPNWRQLLRPCARSCARRSHLEPCRLGNILFLFPSSAPQSPRRPGQSGCRPFGWQPNGGQTEESRAALEVASAACRRPFQRLLRRTPSSPLGTRSFDDFPPSLARPTRSTKVAHRPAVLSFGARNLLFGVLLLGRRLVCAPGTKRAHLRLLRRRTKRPSADCLRRSGSSATASFATLATGNWQLAVSPPQTVQRARLSLECETCCLAAQTGGALERELRQNAARTLWHSP